MLVLFFGFYNYRLAISSRDCHVVTLQSSVRSMLEALAGYFKTKLKFLFKRSDYNLYLLVLETFSVDHYSLYITLQLIV